MIGMIRTLAADIDALAPESAAAVADSVSQILIAGLAALPAARRAPVSQLTAYHREQIKALRARAPARSRASAWRRSPRALRLSPSTLHRAWAGEAVLAERLDLGAAARRRAARPVRPGAARRAR